MQRPNWSRWWRPAVVIAASIVLAGAAGYAQIFSVLATYDDEGYVMISLQSYLQGMPLYDVTFTQYGPAYYQIQGLLHDALDLPLNHDVNRLKTLVVWLLASALSGWIVQRATGSGLVGWMASLAAFLHIDKLCLEPGHPQEMCALLVLASIAAGFALRPGAPVGNLLATAAMGVVVGLAATTKVYVGLLVAVATVCSLTTLTNARGAQRWLAAASAAAAAALPLLLCSQAWQSLPTALFPLMLAGSIAALARITLRWPSTAGLSPACLPVSLASGAAAAGLVVALCRQHGTSWAGLGYGLIGQHLGFDQLFYTSLPLVLAAPLLGLVAAVWAATGRADSQKLFALATTTAWMVIVLCTAGFAIATFTRLRHGLEPRGMSIALSSFAPMVVWAMVRPQAPWAMGRVHLAWIALLQPLIAYPTAGTQVELGHLPLLLCMIILAADRWRLKQPESRPAAKQFDPGQQWAVRWNRSALAMTGALLVVLLVRDVYFTWQRSEMVPLGVPGARRLRLPAAQVAHERALFEFLEAERPETFLFADHGHNRFYFWTGITPPTAKNATFWPYMLDVQAQQEIIQAIQARGRVYVVAMPGGERLFPKSPGPLRNYLQQHYRLERQLEGWQIWTRHSGQPPTHLSASH